ncbi:acyltransferase [Angomonas deanei]|uniref:Acyltransferase, putative n=1 Tax=Angomonas deanei TaxID=59799 RepID=A0A7G2CFE1_9TRYP|nr:acyltransferase [Angomonas deanei]CAD2218618.1 Acyltransferase, putative [Angomonas deanei]|eukprot:EPY39148.1 acyltransferase [Angomonas deanei]
MLSFLLPRYKKKKRITTNIKMSIIIATVVYLAFLYAVRQRALPVIVLRVWFTLNVVTCVILSWALCGVLTLLYKNKVIRKETWHSLSRCVCACTFGGIMPFTCQHIHVEFLEGSLPWKEITRQHDLCLCHTSFFDTLLYLWYVPLQYIYTAKTFAKASLRNLPLFGKVIVACGQYPVYFNSDAEGSFSVEKDKQAAVAEEVEQFLKEGGSLSFFPEGALNKTPEVLKDFRLGSFKQVVAHKLPLYYIVTYGNHEVWNSKLKGIPGFPADVSIYIGEYKYNPENADPVEIARGIREEMQKHLDRMIALRAERKYVPWYKVNKTE